jgi:NitT/TauT family transport system permease protein
LIPFASSFLVSFFPVYVTCRRGMRTLFLDLSEYCDTLRLRRWQRIAALDLFGAAALGGIAMQTAAPLAVVGAVVGEMLVANRGLGFVIVRFQNGSAFAELYCAILATGIVGILFFLLGTAVAGFVARSMGLGAEGGAAE